ncbi:MAG: hypothetical protein ACI4O0_01880 [Candidatus Limivicinus sp.]
MPENENNQKSGKKRGFLWVIIIILIVVLAAVIGGYALTQYYGMPAWLSGFLPGNELVEVEPTPGVEIVSTVPPAPVKASPTPAKPTETPDVAAPEESALPAISEAPVAAAVPSPAVTATPYLGADAAAEAALKHSKVSEKDADISSVLLVEQNGMMLYEVCFSTKDVKFEYYLDACTGRVESWRKTGVVAAAVEDAVPASGGLKPAASPEPTATPAPTPEKNATVLIGEDEAKALAMGHANISEKDLSSIQCKLELEGLKLIYDIEMKTKLMEYDYEIDAISGDVVSFEVEPLRK